MTDATSEASRVFASVMKNLPRRLDRRVELVDHDETVAMAEALASLNVGPKRLSVPSMVMKHGPGDYEIVVPEGVNCSAKGQARSKAERTVRKEKMKDRMRMKLMERKVMAILTEE